MSFGAAAAPTGGEAGFPRIGGGRSCPCGSGERFDGCCHPLLGGEVAPSAERLMRSRYSAFVVGDARYLRQTWHPGTRPQRLELDAAQRWTGLEIVDAVGGGPEDRRGVVEFRAHWRHGRERGVLQERSRFIRQHDRWWYVDGDVS